MSDNVRTKLELSVSGQNMQKRRSPRRKKSNKVEQEQKPTLTSNIVEDVEKPTIEEQNVVFAPNEGPQTEFLAASEREVLYGGQQVVANRLLC